MEERFHLIVFGAGPAGEKAAAQAAYPGKRVDVVSDHRSRAGKHATTGGMPTKTMRMAC